MATDGQTLDVLFTVMAREGASDLHLKVGSSPVLRINQRLCNIKGDPLSEADIWELVEPLMTDRIRDRFERTNNAEFAHSIAGTGRYRLTMLRQRGTLTVVVRRISYDVPGFEELHLPEGAHQCARFEQGLNGYVPFSVPPCLRGGRFQERGLAVLTRAAAVACCLVLLGLTAGAADADEQTPVESKVVHVTVYPEWAYVTREAEVQLREGSARLAFRGLPAWVDDESFRARLGGAEGSKIAGVSVKTTYLARSTEAEVQKAEEEVLGLADAMEDLKNELAVIDEERNYFSDVKLWKTQRAPQQAVWRKVDTEELDAVRKFVFGGIAEAAKRATGIRRRIRDLEPDLTAKKKALNDLKGRTRLEQKEIVVEIESKAEATATLSVSYLISGASWYPGYDARTGRDKSNVQFTCEAVVQQSTGEDWADASFTLSTIQPYLTREKPELKPWYVNASNALSLGINAEPQAQLSRGTRYGLSRSSSARMKLLQAKQLNAQVLVIPEALEGLQCNVERARAVARQVEERGVTVEFDIAGKHSVKADGKPVKLPIGEAGLVASLRYAAVPVVSGSTYVTGEMRNTGEFPFLPGEAKVYVDGSLIGKSKVACVAEGEKFELYLGLEERIRATRDLDAQKSSTSRSGDRKRLVAAYRIEVTNFLDAAAAVEVRDQVPVSQDDRIRAKVLGMEPQTDETEKGIITWVVDLAPGESKEVRFEFRVDYPAGVYIDNAGLLESQIKAKR